MANRKKRRITPKIGGSTSKNIPVLTDKVTPKKGKSYKTASLATFHAGERAIANAENKQKRTGLGGQGITKAWLPWGQRKN